MLTINLPRNMEQKLIEYARQRNEKVDKVIVHALKFYLQEQEELMQELATWDKLSDEAWDNFDKEYL